MLQMFGDVDIPAIIGVLTGFCLVVVVPIVGMLLTHQRRMAELVRGDQARQGASDERIMRLEHEVAVLRQQLAENIIAVDDRRSLISTPPPVPKSSSGASFDDDGARRALHSRIRTEGTPARSAVQMPMSNSVATAFEDDAAFLADHHQTIILTDRAGQAKVAVVPDFQARVMTSTDGASGLSYGWINRELIASGKRVPHMHPFGGEDRFWLGPEGGQFSIFFRKDDPFDLEHWQTPAPLDTDAYDLQSQSESEAVFTKTFDLVNYSGTALRIQVKRTIRVLEPAAAIPDVAIPTGVSIVAFETVNTIINAGGSAWTEQEGLLSIWILSMLKATAQTTVAVPFRAGSEDQMGPVVNADYFGRVPDERLKVGEGVIFFKGDARHRSKIGVSPSRAKDTLGSYDAEHGALTLARFTLPGNTSRYVNSMWEIQAEPFAGDVVNSYNDGPPPAGGPQLGHFYELESSSPALSLSPGESATHRHMTLHAAGDKAGLDALARHALGVGIEEIRQALR